MVAVFVKLNTDRNKNMKRERPTGRIPKLYGKGKASDQPRKVKGFLDERMKAAIKKQDEIIGQKTHEQDIWDANKKAAAKRMETNRKATKYWRSLP